jgi:hypothetical protein
MINVPRANEPAGETRADIGEKRDCNGRAPVACCLFPRPVTTHILSIFEAVAEHTNMIADHG